MFFFNLLYILIVLPFGEKEKIIEKTRLRLRVSLVNLSDFLQFYHEKEIDFIKNFLIEFSYFSRLNLIFFLISFYSSKKN